MSKYAMAIDLDRCNGCNACVIACKVEHSAPNEVLLTTILEKEVGKYPNANRQFIPTLCNHCDNAPCIPVCPTKATYKRPDGIVLVNWDACIGCGACSLACPYDQRHIVASAATSFPTGASPYVNPDAHKAPQGVAMKCDFCFHRVDAGRQPACVETCPTSARIFGWVDGSDTPINNVISRKKTFTLLPDKGTDPNVHYF
jgi:molybdopterin-containing oxidoreductase family iron-sulfur binding subunit